MTDDALQAEVEREMREIAWALVDRQECLSYFRTAACHRRFNVREFPLPPPFKGSRTREEETE